MHLEIDQNPFATSFDDLKKDFKNELGSDLERLYIFQYSDEVMKPDRDNPGRKLVPNKPLMNFFNIMWRNKPHEFKYFESKMTKNSKLGPMIEYSPEYILFDQTGQILVDLRPEAPPAARNLNKVFFLMHNPKRGKGHYLLIDREKMADESIEKARYDSQAIAVLTWPGAPGYITDEALVAVARRNEVPNVEAIGVKELRMTLQFIAKKDPKKFLDTLDKEESKEKELVMEALDYHVLHYDTVKKAYFQTYRANMDQLFTKQMLPEPFLKIQPVHYQAPMKELMNYLNLHPDMMRVVIDELANEKAILESFPKKGKRKAAQLAKEVSVV